MTDYLLPSGAKCSESLRTKNIARRRCAVQLGSKTASLLEQNVYGEVLGSMSVMKPREVTHECDKWRGQFSLAISPLRLRR